MISAVHRNAQVNVDLNAVAYNVSEEAKRLPEDTKMFAVVKANGYGHGAVEIAKIAAENGAYGFCVAVLDEGLELRDAGLTTQPILVLGITNPKWSELAADNNISFAVGSLEWLKEAAEILEPTGKKLKIHLAIDSGMGRIGFIEDDEFLAANKFLQEHPDQFEIEGMFTHFASADSRDESYFDYQVKRFNHLRDQLIVKPRFIHVANTATSMWHTACHSDVVRFGVGIYGLNPSAAPGSDDIEPPFKLRPALSLTSELVFVKQIHPGMGVSYGSTYIAQEDEWIGTIPLGYADGWQRNLQGIKIKVGDVYCENVGRICMDQFMVKLPHEMPVGTPVELIAADEAAPNSLRHVADRLNTLHYEVSSLLTARLPRIYKKD